MIEPLQISEDIYNFIDNIPLERRKLKELVEYVHYKALLDLFTVIIQNNPEVNLDFLLPDYVEVINKLELIVNKLSQEYKQDSKTLENTDEKN